jgi:2-methylcitrate dehydratase PrpD
MTSEIRYPKGHEKSPMSDVEIEAKFIGMASHTLGRQQTVQALSQLWKIEQVSNVASIIDLFKPHE